MWPHSSPPAQAADPASLSQTLQEQVRRLERRLEEMADSLLRGDRLSGFPGRGMEVSGVREYRAGDEARGIDWRVTARTGRLHVKEFEEERDLSSLVVLHRSWALRGGRGGIRMVRALEVAGILSALALRCGDRAGLLQNGTSRRGFLSPARGPNQLPSLVAALLEPTRDSASEPLHALLERAGHMVRERSRIFLVAGFHLPGPELMLCRRELMGLARRHALVPVRVADPGEGSFHGPCPVPLEAPGVGVVRNSGRSSEAGALREALDREDERTTEMFRALELREWRVHVSLPLLPSLNAFLKRGQGAGGVHV